MKCWSEESIWLGVVLIIVGIVATGLRRIFLHGSEVDLGPIQVTEQEKLRYSGDAKAKRLPISPFFFSAGHNLRSRKHSCAKYREYCIQVETKTRSTRNYFEARDEFGKRGLS